VSDEVDDYAGVRDAMFNIDPHVREPRFHATYTEMDYDIELLVDAVASQAGLADSSVDGVTVEADHENVKIFMHYCNMDEPQLVLVRPAR